MERAVGFKKIASASRSYNRRLLQQNLPISDMHSRLTTLREMLIKIGAKVVRHGRYVIFQMAEVAVARKLFGEILRLIDGPRPRAAPA